MDMVIVKTMMKELKNERKPSYIGSFYSCKYLLDSSVGWLIVEYEYML